VRRDVWELGRGDRPRRREPLTHLEQPGSTPGVGVRMTDPKPTIEELEDAIPDEKKNLSFGNEDEGLIDVMEQSEREAHKRGAHDGTHPTCPLCDN